MGRIKAALGIALILCRPISAQDVGSRAAEPQDSVRSLGVLAGTATDLIVERIGQKEKLRVRLIALNGDRLLVVLNGRTKGGDTAKLEIPLAEVRRVQMLERDRPIEGAIFGALFVTACGLWWCQQGTSGESGTADLIIGAGLGAAVFGAIDYAIPRSRTVYTAAQAPQQARLAFGWSYRW